MLLQFYNPVVSCHDPGVFQRGLTELTQSPQSVFAYTYTLKWGHSPVEATHRVQRATQLSALCSSVKGTDSFHCPYIGVVTGVDPLCLQYVPPASAQCTTGLMTHETAGLCLWSDNYSAMATCLEIYCKQSKAVWLQLFRASASCGYLAAYF